MNFALVRFLNTHVRSVEREEKRPSGEKPTNKTVTRVLLVNPPERRTQTRHVTRKMAALQRRTSADNWRSSRGAPDAQTTHTRTHTHAHTHTKRLKTNIASGPCESTCRSLALRQCTFAISNQRFQSDSQFREAELLQQESSSAANTVSITLRPIYAPRALAASQFLHPPPAVPLQWVEKRKTTIKGKKKIPSQDEKVADCTVSMWKRIKAPSAALTFA